MLEDVTNLVSPGLYRHFKGDIYEVLYCGRHSEDLSVLVAYKKNGRVWFRPIKLFQSRMPDGTLRYTPLTLQDTYDSLLKEQGEYSYVVESDKVGVSHLESINFREPVEDPYTDEADVDGDLDDEDIREFISYEDKNHEAAIKMKLSRAEPPIYDGPGADALPNCTLVMLDEQMPCIIN